jgi:membrane protein implicated in regulation of membrane protease activity
MIIGFIIILVLSGIARILSVSGAAISTPWIIGFITVTIYAFIKYIIRKARAKREAKKAERIAQQTPPTPPPTQIAGE